MRQNLITNPSFERGITGWTASLVDAVATTDESKEGQQGLQFTAQTYTGTSDVFISTTAGVTAGKNYIFSAYVKAYDTLKDNYYLCIVYKDSTGASLGNKYSSSAINGACDWTRLYVSQTAPVGATQAVLYVVAVTDNVDHGGDMVFVDACLFEEGSALGDYFDGDTMGYAWDGTPHVSTSSTVQVLPPAKPGSDNLRLEIETPVDGLPNLIQNPSGDLGAWGWITPVNNTVLTAVVTNNVTSLEFKTTAAQAAYFTSEFIEATAGKYYKARYDYTYSAGGTINVRTRFDFYDANKVLISSSAQTAGGSTSTTYYTPSVVAPANTAWVKLRFDMYNGTGNPAANNLFRFRRAMVAQTNDASTVLQVHTNLLRNPSAETYAWDNSLGGWWAERSDGSDCDIARVAMTGGSGSYAIKATGRSGLRSNGNLHVWVMPVAWSAAGYKATRNQWPTVTPGTRYTLQVKVKAATTGRRVYLRLWWVKETGNWETWEFVSYNQKIVGSDKSSGWTTLTYEATAPSGVNRMSPFLAFEDVPDGESHYIDSVIVTKTDDFVGYFDGSTPNDANYSYAWTGTPHDSQSTQTNKGDVFDYAEPNDWQDILGPTHEITINRDSLDVGTLSATILDATLDPAVADWITPGKKIRLLSSVGDDWESIYQGKLTNADVTYTKPKVRNAPVDVSIAITAADNVSHLANQGEARGVEKIADLSYILEGKGVPWNVNGSGGQVATANVVSINENASVLDQISITRDSELGYAWVDRYGILNAWSSNKMTTAPAVTFSDGASNDPAWISYSDIAVNFNTESCINDVTVVFLRYDAASGQTEEVSYGPYRDDASIKKWGARSATFTIQALAESPSAIAAYAQSILAANATPVIRANSLTMPVRNDKERAFATTLDLYSPVAVKYANKVDNTYRITTVTHTITPDKWTVEYGFDTTSSVAAPQVTPSPNKSGVSDVTPFNAINVKSGKDANTTAGNTPALMVGPRDGIHLRIDGNEILAMTNDSTQGSLYINSGGTTALNIVNVNTLNLPTASGTFKSIASIASGWSWANDGNYYKYGPFIMATVAVTRTGADVPMASNGNITNTLVCTINGGYRPPVAVTLNSAGSGKMTVYQLGTEGTITAIANVAGYGITQNESLSISGIWFTG